MTWLLKVSPVKLATFFGFIQSTITICTLLQTFSFKQKHINDFLLLLYTLIIIVLSGSQNSQGIDLTSFKRCHILF